MLTLTSTELHSLLSDSQDSLELIDVRRTDEFQEVHITEAEKNIPLHLLPMRMSEIDTNKKIIMICRSGARSAQACQLLEQNNIPAYNLVGGTIAYEQAFPDGVTREPRWPFWNLFSQN